MFFFGGPKTTPVQVQFDLKILNLTGAIVENGSKLRIRWKCGDSGNWTLDATSQGGIATFDEVMSCIVFLDVAVDTAVVQPKTCKLQIHQVTGSKTKKIDTVEMDLAQYAPKPQQSPDDEGKSTGLDVKGGLAKLAVHIRSRIIPDAAGEEDGGESSVRSALEGDLQLWGADGSPYDEAADWNAAGTEESTHLADLESECERLRASMNELENDWRARFSALEEEHFSLTGENKDLIRTHKAQTKQLGMLTIEKEELLAQTKRLQDDARTAHRHAEAASRNDHQATADALREENEDMRRQMSEMQASQQELELTCQELKMHNTTLVAQLAEAEENNKKATKLKMENAKLSARCDILKQELEGAGA